MNGRLDTTGERPVLRFERRLDHPVQRGWRAITDPDELRDWFPGVPRFPLEAGAEFVTAAGWELCFDRLAGLLAGTPISDAESLARWPERHERCAEAFGLDPEVGRRTFAQHRSQQ